MQATIEVSKSIAADAATVWQTISSKTDVDKWFPAVITSCHVDGDKRYCTMAGGGKLVEDIGAIDVEAMTFHYVVTEHPLPVGPVSTTVKVSREGNERARITWSAKLDGEQEALAQVKPMLEGLYGQGIDALETYCGGK